MVERWKIMLLIAVLTFFGFTLSTEAKIRAVATFSVIADLVQQVGGEYVEVVSLIPAGGDPHSWEATTREARAVAQADVVFYNGLGLEQWLDRVLANAASPRLPIIVLSEGITPLEVGGHGLDHHGHTHSGGDPHLWLDVANAIKYVEKIKDTLSKLDPDNRARFAENAQAYRQELEKLDSWLKEQIGQIPPENRRIITYHDGFRYFANRYGLQIDGIMVANTEQELNPQQLASLTRLVRSHPTRAVFAESQSGQGFRYAQTVAAEAGGRVYVLYSESFPPQANSYVEMMRHNGETLVEALK